MHLYRINDNYASNWYNANASGGQIASIFTADTDWFPSHIYVTVKPVGQDLPELNFNNPLVDPLLFPFGTIGFSSDISHNRDSHRSNRVGLFTGIFAERLSYRANCGHSISKTS